MTVTSAYPYCEFPFYEWNPVQEKCLPYFTRDCNLVVSASVAAGKTAIAEAVIAYELAQSPKAKAIYVSPLKSLSTEKYDQWVRSRIYGDSPIVQIDGDHHDAAPEELAGARVVIATVESLHICVRRGDRWTEDAAVLVFDEAHLFDAERRGPVSEAMMMDFSERCPAARLILLSGTLSNARDMAVWLKTLNGKPTPFVVSGWRPTALEKEVVVRDRLDSQLRYVCDSVCDSEKTLVFVHSKKIGALVVERLKARGIKTALFTADVQKPVREKMLAAYRSRYSALNTLVATSSLSMGVSL